MSSNFHGQEIKENLYKSKSEIFTSKRIKTKYNFHPRIAFLFRVKITQLMNYFKFQDHKRYSLSIYRQICKFFSKTLILRITDSVFQVFVSILVTLLYVIETYRKNNDKCKTIIFFEIFEFILITIIAICLLIHFLKSKRKLTFFFKQLNLIDLLTIVLFYLHFFVDSNKLGFFRVFRMIRVTRVLRIIRFLTLKQNDTIIMRKATLSKKVFSSLLTIFTFIFFFAGIIHYISNEFSNMFQYPSEKIFTCSSGVKLIFSNSSEKMSCPNNETIMVENNPMTFDMALYYIVITITSVGYGEIFPISYISRLIVAIIIITLIIIVSKQNNEINLFIQSFNIFDQPYKQKNCKHIIISGFLDSLMLKNFLRDFYFPKHRSSEKRVNIVIIQKNHPDDKLLSILSDSKYEDNLTLIVGDIMDKTVLDMAYIKGADRVFLMVDQRRYNFKEDLFLILACKNIAQISPVKINVQFNYSQSLVNDWSDWNQSFASNQMKYSIIVKNYIVHGFSTFIMNLITSPKTFHIKKIKNLPWMIEYLNGSSQSIYIVKCENKDHFPVDINFKEFSSSVYLRYNIIIIGVRHKFYYKKNSEDFKDIYYNECLINPINYKLCEDDSFIVIANDLKEASKIFSEKYKQIDFDNVPTESNSFLSDFTIRNEEYQGKDDFPYIFENKKFFNFNVIEDIQEIKSYLKNHFLVFCIEEHLWEFVAEFNKMNHDFLYVIVNRESNMKNGILWRKLVKKYLNIIKIEINYENISDLIHLNLNEAKHTFILSSCDEKLKLPDSSILILVKIIDNLFPKCKYTLELADEMSINYLHDPFSHLEKENIDLTALKHKLIPYHILPKYVKSDIFFSKPIDSILSFSYNNKGVLNCILKLLRIENYEIRKKFNHIIRENNSFTMLCYKGKNKIIFSNIFKEFIKLSESLICVAVYRSFLKELKNPCQFIVTNPDNNTIIFPGDEIICIGKSNYFPVDSFSNIKLITHEEKLPKKFQTDRKTIPNVEINRKISKDTYNHMDDNDFLEHFKGELNSLRSLINLTNELKTKDDFNVDKIRKQKTLLPNNLGILKKKINGLFDNLSETENINLNLGQSNKLISKYNQSNSTRKCFQNFITNSSSSVRKQFYSLNDSNRLFLRCRYHYLKLLFQKFIIAYKKTLDLKDTNEGNNPIKMINNKDENSILKKNIIRRKKISSQNSRNLNKGRLNKTLCKQKTKFVYR